MPELQMKFFQFDPAAKADIISIATDAAKPWSDLDVLKYDNVLPPKKYMTLEQNFTLLDGTFELFPNDPIGKLWGWWSKKMSDTSARYLKPPTFDVSFGANHKSRGLTLYFYPHTNDFAREVRATWYSVPPIYEYGIDSDGDVVQIEIYSGVIIKSGIYTLSSNIGVIREAVEGFRHIKLEMLSSAIPYRYIKLFAIDYGVLRILEDNEINSCNILEEIDPTVESISVNTLNANIRTRDSVFSPITSPDFDDMMMQRQVLTVTRDGAPFGTFFLTDWEDVYQSGIVFDFSADDAMGVLDLYPFMGGIYDDVPVSDVLTEIFDIAFPTRLIKYILDPVFADVRVSGWVPITTCGTAFQHICFRLNAVADTARIGDIWIYPRDTETTFDIPLEKQYRRGSDKPTEYFSGVNVVSHNYVASAETTEVQNGELPAGQYEIRFSEPLHSLVPTGAEIVKAHANYAIIRVVADGNVILSGSRYVDNRRTHTSRVEIAAGEIENIKSYEDYTLVSPDIGQALAETLFAYLQHRIITETDVVLDDLEVGYKADIETRGRKVTGTITSLDINLRANKAAMTAIGDVEATNG